MPSAKMCRSRCTQNAQICIYLGKLVNKTVNPKEMKGYNFPCNLTLTDGLT